MDDGSTPEGLTFLCFRAHLAIAPTASAANKIARPGLSRFEGFTSEPRFCPGRPVVVSHSGHNGRMTSMAKLVTKHRKRVAANSKIARVHIEVPFAFTTQPLSNP